MSWRFCLLLSVLVCAALAPGQSSAQLALPGAMAPADAGAPAKPASIKHKSAAKGAANAKSKEPDAPSVASLTGRPLLLNGGSGLLQVSGDDNIVTIEKLQLAGEGVSDPSQRCMVDIVGDKPIQATNVGRPDGLERFDANIPACPFSFDVLDGAALAPSQITACVFKAADCQTSPGGLWGPEGASLVNDAAAFVKERAQAENAMGKTLQAIQALSSDNPDVASLLRDQNSFPGQRDDACRAYVKESVHGYCALRLTQARTALLEARLAEFRTQGVPKAEADKNEKGKKKKKRKTP